MKLTEFIYKLQEIEPRRPDINVVIPIHRVFTTFGGTPVATIQSITTGLDWDSGKIFINPTSKLMLVSDYTDAPETIKKLQDKIGWLEYEANGYKSEIKRLNQKVKELENANLRQTNQ